MDISSLKGKNVEQAGMSEQSISDGDDHDEKVKFKDVHQQLNFQSNLEEHLEVEGDVDSDNNRQRSTDYRGTGEEETMDDNSYAPVKYRIAKRLKFCALLCCLFPLSVIVLVLIGLFFTTFYSPLFFATYTAKLETNPSFVHKGHLSNGFSYMIYPNPDYQDNRMSVLLQVNTGSTNEKDNELGIAHFVEHMAFDNSIDYPGRAGVWNQIIRHVPIFNAFTNFRNTVYMLLAFKDIDQAMKLLKNQVLTAEHLDSSVQLEKGAVLGECRMSNDSSLFATALALRNHGGNDWRIGYRFPIGDPEQIRSWKSTNTQSYYNKWYKCNKMKLYLSGHVDNVIDVAKKIESFWNEACVGEQQEHQDNASENIEIGIPKPEKPILFVKNVQDLSGLNFNLMISRPYRSGYPQISNDFRNMLNDQMFSLYFTLEVMERFIQEYPETMSVKDLEAQMRGASAVTLGDNYMFNASLDLLTIVSPLSSNTYSTWRNDLEIVIEELQELAYEGPNTITILALSFALDAYYQHSSNTMRYHSQIIFDMLGNEDPNREYVDSKQKSEMSSYYLGFAFQRAIVENVQSHAQYIYEVVHELVNSKDPNQNRPFPHIIDSSQYQASMSIFVASDEKVKEISDMVPGMDFISENDVINTIKNTIKSRSPMTSRTSLLNESLNINRFDYEMKQIDSALEINDPLQNMNKLQSSKEQNQLFPKIIRSSVLTETNRHGIMIAELSSGIRVNYKPRITNAQTSPRGQSFIEIIGLGGKQSTTKRLHGACTLINMYSSSPKSYRYYNSEGVKYISSNSIPYPPKLRCNEEYISLTAQLQQICPTNSDCQNAESYDTILGLSRLALHPNYDSLGQKEAISTYEMLLEQEFEKNPLSYLTNIMTPSRIEKLIAENYRFHRIGAQHLRDLNPLEVSYWISNHFLDHKKMEINIVGDVNIQVLLRQLEKWFGSDYEMTSKFSSLSIDLDDDRNFNTTFPTSGHFHCKLKSFAGRRAFENAIVPAKSADASSNFMESLIANSLLRSYSFDQVRSKGAYSYFVFVIPYISHFYPSLSHYQLVYATGDYPNSKNETQDSLNIHSSFDHILNVLSKSSLHFSEMQFKLFLSEFIAREEYLQENVLYWLGLLRGLGIQHKGHYLKSIEEFDEMNSMIEQQKSRFSSYWSTYFENMVDNRMIRLSLETIEHSNDSASTNLCHD